MPLSQPKILYGIHCITPYSRTDRTPFGILKVIGSASFELSSEQELLYAGSAKFPWASEAKTISSSVTAKVKAYPGFMFSLFLGAQVTDNAAEASGFVSPLTAGVAGLFSATIGVASVAVIPSTGAANLKFGKYMIKALTTTTVGVYAFTDIDFNRGNSAANFVDDGLTVVAPITVTTAGVLTIPSLGVQLVGGSGAIAMTVGGTATFEVRPPNSASRTIVIGSQSTSLPNFGAIFLAQKRATGEMFEMDARNCVGSGLPISLEEQAFSQPEAKITCLYDSATDSVLTIRDVTPLIP